MMNRRDFTLTALLALALRPGRAAALQSAEPVPPSPLWEAWKAAFLDPSGRVVDALQDGISHSEGQGYALYLAAAFGDAEAFGRIHDWTEANLAVRDDGLLAWRWSPDSGTVTDTNNASDGDLFYAWALVRAAQSFGDPGYLERAGGIVADLAARCLVASPQDAAALVLLPAAEGFATQEGVVVNPSYYMPRAMRELAQATGQPILARAAADGEALLAALAATGPVPDWVEITAAGPRAAAGFSADAGYEALRVPLFLIWSGLGAHPAVLQAALAHAGAPGDGTVTVFDAATGAARDRSPDPGYAALAALAACAADPALVGSAVPDFTARQFYYPATLHLFAILAQTDALPRCFPI